MENQPTLDILANYKHGRAIELFFEGMFESWMDDQDKAEFILLSLQQSGKTLSDVNEEIETGIKNGYSISQQLEAVRNLKPIMHEAARKND